MTRPLEETNLALAAYERLKTRICDGSFPMGEKLSEAQLAAEACVSRTPIRVALARLEAEGFLTWKLNHGYTVTVFSIKDVREIYGVRALLEAEAVRLCGRRGLTTSLYDHLSTLTREMGNIVSCTQIGAEGRKAFLNLNHRFHRKIYDSCGNQFLLRQIASTADLPLALRNYFNFSSKEITDSHAAHLNILEALKADEADRAAELMREHILAARDRMSVKKTLRTQPQRNRARLSRRKLVLVPGKIRSGYMEEGNNGQ